jgi:hypothetical protein
MPLAEDQAALLPEDVRSDPGLQSFNDFGGLAKSYLETKSMVGRSIQLPGKDSKPEDVDKWAGETSAKLKDHGYVLNKPSDPAPASPDAYEFKVEGVAPEVIKADPILNEFRAFAHSKGMNNAMANDQLAFFQAKIMPLIQKNAQGQLESVDMVEEEGQINKIIEERFKGETVTRRSEYDRGILALSPVIPDLPDFLEGTAPYGKSWIPNKSHPAIIQLISEVGRMTGQDFGGNMNSNGNAVDHTALSEARDIQSNPDNAKYKLYRNNDRETVAYVNSLYEKAHGKGEVNPNDFAPKLKMG